MKVTTSHTEVQGPGAAWPAWLSNLNGSMTHAALDCYVSKTHLGIYDKDWKGKGQKILSTPPKVSSFLKPRYLAELQGTQEA